MSPRHVGGLQAARLDACVLANNHVLDWGLVGLADTRQALSGAAIAIATVGASAAALVHGHSSHHPLPLERHRGHLVLTGCGDLINDDEGIAPGPADRRSTLRANLGCLFFAALDACDGRLRALEVAAMQRRRWRLQTAVAEARAATARLLGGTWSEDAKGLRLLNGRGAAATEHASRNAAEGPSGPAAAPGTDRSTGETT